MLGPTSCCTELGRLSCIELGWELGRKSCCTELGRSECCIELGWELDRKSCCTELGRSECCNCCISLRWLRTRRARM